MSEYVFDVAKWSRMSIFEQMGNIGSEVGRTLMAKRRNDQVSLVGALYRGLNLFDITAELASKKKSSRTREILRAREQFIEAATTDKDDPNLENYFMQFAIAARLKR